MNRTINFATLKKDFDISVSAASITETTMTKDVQQYRVLLIDDSQNIRVLVKKLLSNYGFQNIEMAENGLIGLQKIQSFSPDIIFLDGIMPEMDGLTVLREVKTHHRETVVIITTSLSSKEMVLQFKESGADFYLLKPFEEKKFSEVIEKAVTLVEQRKQQRPV
ncbi:MAG: response regulator [Bacteroidetes bacterium]|nr:MAG: response regulator [Bacteroidota bacterium]